MGRAQKRFEREGLNIIRGDNNEKRNWKGDGRDVMLR